ncbi:PREDICTED: uncharacterized protein LOC106324338 [Brassica oleracea var. oleracea]|uniref:uncharacterized protein LOC106324338 n=1 Tax=Brassica oleracea var. oleracea TaxID=109376 RepID=UPI0006A6F58D|nr:PREDICTED: uncharacterized protein LOC106324338 [Brassica oleracea var. oleracea]
MGNVADETTRRSLFGASLYQMGSVSGNTSGPVAVQTPPFVPSVFTQGLMPNKFDGKGFITWQKKMLFFLTTLKLDKFIQEDKPLVSYRIDNVHTLASVDIWVHSDFVCKGYILGRLIDPLYRVYCEIPTAEELWRSLDKKCRGEDACCQKYVVSKFHKFKMVDSKPIMDQVEAFQLICHKIAAEGISISDKVTAKEHSVNMAKYKGKGKFKGKCHYCHKVGHKTDVCRNKIRDEKHQANLTEEDLVAMVTETDMGDVSTYQKNKTHEKLFIGNTAVSKIEGRGNVILKMTYGREVTLANVKHVPDMRKNLVSGTLLSKNGFVTSLEADKLVIN